MSQERTTHLKKVSLASASKVFAIPGQGFYIPAFQRLFAWDAENIGRLFEDVVAGINELAGLQSRDRQPDIEAVTFLGTIVCFADAHPFKLVSPHVDDEVPPSIYVVIDGQQRLTVLAIIALLLHNFLREKRIADVDGAAINRELANIQTNVMEGLLDMLRIAYRSSERSCLPKIIRGPVDTWALTMHKSKYQSQISSLISQYMDCISNESSTSQGKIFNYKISNGSSEAIFPEAHNTIQHIISTLAGGGKVEVKGHSIGKLPDVTEVFSSGTKGSAIMPTLFSLTSRGSFFEDSTQAIKEAEASEDASGEKLEAANKLQETQYEIARVLLLSSYMLHRVQLVCIVTDSVHYAYSIFDSLNTTGDPLTAYEAFRPRVFKFFGFPGRFSRSEVKTILKELDAYLDLTKAQQDMRTAEFLTIFALAESGVKLPKKLNEQRKYLNKNFTRSGSVDFLKNMLHVSRVHAFFSQEDYKSSYLYRFLTNHQLQLNENSPCEARFCLRFLAKARHTISIPIISRFYAKAELSQKPEDHDEMCSAIKAIAAFFALWRSSRIDTDKIDSHHRSIMNPTRNRNIFLKSFMRASDFDPDIQTLLDILNNILRSENISSTRRPIKNMKSWVDLAKDMPIYTKAKAVAKFILLLASQYASPLSNHGTLSSAGRAAGLYPIDERYWDHEAHSTIEHILPQSSEAAYVGNRSDIIHHIGNLALLPQEINSHIGNAIWSERQLFYIALSSATDEQLEATLREIEDQLDGNKLNEATMAQLRESSLKIREEHPCMRDAYLPILKSIASYPNFDLDTVSKRSENLLSLAWQPLDSWLEFSSRS